MNIPFRILQAGTCTGPQSVAMKGAPRKKVTFPALCALLEHPTRGPILYDTGYAPFLFEAAKTSFAIRLYLKVIPVSVDQSQSAAAQLEKLGVRPDELKTLIISHFHPDHVAGLRDFPNAEFRYFREAYESALRLSKFKRSMKAFFPHLHPLDLEERSKPIDLDARSANPAPYDIFDHGVDLFGDGSIRGIPLPGHAYGQMGLAFNDGDGRPVFLCADAAWYSQSIRERRPPSSAARFLMSSVPEFHDSFERLCDFHERNPDVEIIPAHCPEIVEKYVNA
ncbi:MAG: glyoxylase-like metal-dependent hydrolase (beta-lactamase superfamily II) [Verrucomicrobiales bacterium]|jgi:glyoxylase-like metal-dependent hydrolase (beta-lactamase superfamily II)